MILYKATNLISRKCYIGQTIHSLEKRKYYHLYQGYYFHQALRKYRAENFKWEVLCFLHSKEQMNEQEKFYISIYNTNEKEWGYNLTNGGEDGKIHSIETIEKIKKSLCGKLSGKNNPAFGNKYWLGRKHSQETKEKLSLINKGRIISEEAKRLIGDSHRGKQVSIETRQKMRKAHLGKIHTLETKKKMSEKRKEFWRKKCEKSTFIEC